MVSSFAAGGSLDGGSVRGAIEAYHGGQSMPADEVTARGAVLLGGADIWPKTTSTASKLAR
jgi:hypothetical protein